MREIKFRFWNNTTKCIYVDTGMTSLGLNDAIKKAIEADYEVMQYTGLKDKNGKEIYEGDILVCGPEAKPGEIFYSGGSACFAIRWKDDTAKNGFFGQNLKMMISMAGSNCGEKKEENLSEILGNIYENPELVNEQQR